MERSRAMKDIRTAEQYVVQQHGMNNAAAARELGVSTQTVINAVRYKSGLVLDDELYTCDRLYRKGRELAEGKRK